MTIAALDKEIKGVIDEHKVYGAECVINALVRGCKGEQYLTEDYLIKLVHESFELERFWEDKRKDDLQRSGGNY